MSASSLGLSLPFGFESAAWLWLVALVPLLGLASWRSLAGLEPGRRAASLAARGLLVILVACCLAGIQSVRRTEDLTVIFLMDRSFSVQAKEEYQDQFVRAASETIGPNDRVGLVDFARHSYLQQLPMTGGYFVPPGRLPPAMNTDRTDIAAALRLAMALFPHDANKRVVLMSDGNDNMGDVLSEARRLGADGIPVDVLPLTYEHANEVYFDQLIAPTHAEEGEVVTLRMNLHSHTAASGTLNIFHNGQLVELSAEEARVNLVPGPNTYFVRLRIREAGTQTYQATFVPDDERMDAIALNNTATAFTFVSGQSRVLVISGFPEHDAALVDALRGENILVDVRPYAELGDFGLLQMMNYASIILANVPAAAFTDDQQRELAAYVKDMGSGLIMLGGDESYGAGGWIGSPVEEVMPVTFEIKHKRVIPRGALVLIMHSCEIPRGNYWGKEMAKKSVDTISSQDYIGVLAYTYSPGGENWEVPMQFNTNKAAVKARIDRMEIGDMPDFGRTLQMAYRELTAGIARDAAQRHVIILSDGDSQPPSPSLIKDFADAKITISTIAIGWGMHVFERTLIDIARETKGKYYAAKNPRELPQIFVKESKVVRRPLVIDEPFQPQIRDAASELLSGINPMTETAPPLGGMVLTSPKPSPHVMMPLVRLDEDNEDPVLVHWQYQLGKTVAFTSGWWPSWGQDWTQWPKFARFWAQIVRWSMRQDTPANFDAYTKIEGGRGTIMIDALARDASYLNNLVLQGNIVGPDRQSIPVQFVQKGPGIYHAEFDAERSGQYLASVQIYDQGRQLGTLRTGISAPFSPEYRDLTTNESLLRQVVDATGGRWLDGPIDAGQVFSRDMPPLETRRPAWDWVLAWLLLPLFLLDVAVRRLASWLALSIAVEAVVLVVLLFGVGLIYTSIWGVLGAFLLAELIGWTIRFRYIRPLYEFMTHSVTALAHTGTRSARSLEQLKGTRDKVREGLESGSKKTASESDEASGGLPADIARRRFDVGDARARAPATTLEDALDGAKAGEDADSKPMRRPAGAGKAGAGDESTTSRLLKTKRRGKQGESKDGE